MVVDATQVNASIASILAVEHCSFTPSFVADDIWSLVEVWDEEKEFNEAVAATIKALNIIANGKALSARLTRELKGWESFHYLHTTPLRGSADMRIIFRRVGGEVEVLGFGHRFLPSDIYERAYAHSAKKTA